MAVIASMSVFAFTGLPRSHRPVRRLGAVGVSLIAFNSALPWNAPDGLSYALFGGALFIVLISLVAWMRFRRVYVRDHETHFCYLCGQLQTPGEEPTVCPECGSRIFFRMPGKADAMDLTVSLSENENVIAMQRANLRATWPRALLLAGLLVPVALLCGWVGRAMDHAGFWVVIAAMWTIASMTGAHLVTIGVRAPAA